MAAIDKDNLSNVYLIYGEEAYKRRNYKEQLRKIVTQGNDLNYAYFEGQNIDFSAVYDSVITMPFFAAHRLVIVENSGRFRQKQKKKAVKEEAGIEGQNELDALSMVAARDIVPVDMRPDEDLVIDDEKADKMLLKILEELPPTTILAFIEESAAASKKLYKEIDSRGKVVICDSDSTETLIMWLAKGFAKAGKKIRKSTAEMIVNLAGNDYDRLRTEYEKILGYVGNADVINDADVLAVISVDVEGKIFDMLSAMSVKDVKNVLNRYYELLACNEPPLRVLAMIRTQFRSMLQVAELCNKGLSDNEVASALKKKSGAIWKIKQNLAHFKRAQIEAILNEIDETDRKCKTGLLDQQLAVELMLVTFSS